MAKLKIKGLCPAGVRYHWRGGYPWPGGEVVVDAVDYDPDDPDDEGEEDPENVNTPNETPTVINRRTLAALEADPCIVINSGEDPAEVERERRKAKEMEGKMDTLREAIASGDLTAAGAILGVAPKVAHGHTVPDSDPFVVIGPSFAETAPAPAPAKDDDKTAKDPVVTSKAKASKASKGK